MSTKRLKLPCSFAQKDTPRTQPIRPVSLSVEKPFEAKRSESLLKRDIRLPPSAKVEQTVFIEGRREHKFGFWEKDKSLKRNAEHIPFRDEDNVYRTRAKRKRGNGEFDDSLEEETESFWMLPGSIGPHSLPLVTGIDPPQLPFCVSFSEEEELRAYNSNVITPPLLLSNNHLVESVVNEITKLGGKNLETNQYPVKETSGLSSPLGSRLFSPRSEKNLLEHEIGNGSRPCNPTELSKVQVRHSEYVNHSEDEGFELINLLVACAQAIGAKNIPGFNQLIARLGVLASPRGSSISRVTAYFTEALSLQAVRLWPQIFHISPQLELDCVDDDCRTGLRLLNQVTPIPRFIYFTANEIQVRAFEGKEKVHIIDFDIKQGLQWPGLFQSLASRPNPPSYIRITGIGESKQELIETGDRLAGFAEELDLPFEFHPVVSRLEDVRLWMLHVKENESVAVNCMFQLHEMLYDSTGGVLRNFFRLVRSTNPVIFVMAEQEEEHDEGTLEVRLGNSFRYYSAIFDALENKRSTRITLGWLDQPFYTVSAWEVLDFAGSSPSLS